MPRPKKDGARYPSGELRPQMTTTWHVITTEPRREMAVAAGLVGYRVQEVYLPTYQARVPAPPRVQKPFMLVDRPMFPSYLFARMGSGGDWEAVHRVSGVSGYLRGQDGPKLISEAEIALVRQVEEEMALQTGEELKFTPGDHVRIDQERNPWTGLNGIIERLDKSDRVIVLLMNKLRISAPIDCLRSVG